MRAVTGSQRTGLFKMTTRARLPGSMHTYIGARATTETRGTGMRAPDAPQLAALSKRNGKKSLALFWARAGLASNKRRLLSTTTSVLPVHGYAKREVNRPAR